MQYHSAFTRLVSIAFGFVFLCVTTTARADETLNQWLSKQLAYSQQYLIDNIGPAGAARGAVVASPSKNNPDYFYHWIRDSSLTMSVVVQLYQKAAPADKERFFSVLSSFVDFSRQNQTTPNPSGGLGEPKFNADGSAFTGAWGRPQNDGPALRAITLSRLAAIWLSDGHEALVKEKLYRPELPAATVIKADLEYVSHHWQETCFDLWEESRGHHFYTEMVQRRALLDGAKLAEALGDGGAATWYRSQAAALESLIARHWDGGKQILTVTIDRDGGIDYKNSGLDSSVLLAVLHGYAGDGFYPVTDSRLMATVKALEDTFQNLYPINHAGFPAIAIGRYPEDRYNGYTTGAQGNPWVLLTAGFAEFYYRLGTALQTLPSLAIDAHNLGFLRALDPANAWAIGQTLTRGSGKLNRLAERARARGDDFLDRVRRHSLAQGHFSEEINRNTGEMQGASDLTWNYASLLTALWERH